MTSLLSSLFLIFSGAAIFSTFALFTRQSLLVGYIFLGVLIGPWGFDWVHDTHLVENIGDIGIIFLLFLLGLHLHPQKLFQMLKKVSVVTILASCVFFTFGSLIARYYGYSWIESWIIGSALTFSSTIIGLKLLPSTVLHHQHTGDLMIGVLLMQDIIAIGFLLVLHALGVGVVDSWDFAVTVLALPGILLFTFLIERYLLRWLFKHFEAIQEYTFLLSIAWCLGIAELGHYFGLSREVGAFMAGVSIATSPIALYIAECLKPLRDFFLVMFFFSIGASFDLNYFCHNTLLPAMLLAVVFLIIKPVTYRLILRQVSESKHVAWELGFRLGQLSEFSLLVAAMAHNYTLISASAANLIQASTILTFVVSSYLVVFRYPTPISMSKKLRRD